MDWWKSILMHLISLVDTMRQDHICHGARKLEYCQPSVTVHFGNLQQRTILCTKTAGNGKCVLPKTYSWILVASFVQSKSKCFNWEWLQQSQVTLHKFNWATVDRHVTEKAGLKALKRIFQNTTSLPLSQAVNLSTDIMTLVQSSSCPPSVQLTSSPSELHLSLSLHLYHHQRLDSGGSCLKSYHHWESVLPWCLITKHINFSISINHVQVF